jgi:four helix bundle protein
MAVKSFHDLYTWQKAMELVEEVYRLTQFFPKEETYGLRSQVRRAAVSIPSNIAEGQGRESTKEFQHFLSIARGSLYEVITQLLIAQRLKYITKEQLQPANGLSDEVGKLINGLINSLKS